MNVINQCKAIRGAMQRVEALILESHLKACLVDAIKQDQYDEEFLEEILELYR